MDNLIIASVQVLPLVENKEKRYEIIEQAIEIIQNSNLKYFISPMETIIEGSYKEIMQLIEKINEKVVASQATIMTNIRLIMGDNEMMSIEEKMKKYK